MWRFSFLACFLTAALVGASITDSAPAVGASAMTARASEADLDVAAPQDTIARSHDGLFYITGRGETGSARFLVDTGASHVILSHADAKTITTRADTGRVQAIATAGGPIEAEWVIIEKLELQGHVLREVVAAVPHRDVGISLLGQSALVQFSGVRIDGDRLSLVR
jgi:aspartyl protease family protein